MTRSQKLNTKNSEHIWQSRRWFLFETRFKKQKTNLGFPRIFDNPFAKYLVLKVS